MDQQRQRWVNLVYIAAAALFSYVVFELSTRLAATYDLEARVRNVDLWLRGVSLFLGAILFAVCYLNGKINQFTHEVVAELSRVTWPTSRETSRSTVVVIVMVLIAGVVLGGLDGLWSWLIKFII